MFLDVVFIVEISQFLTAIQALPEVHIALRMSLNSCSAAQTESRGGFVPSLVKDPMGAAQPGVSTRAEEGEEDRVYWSSRLRS